MTEHELIHNYDCICFSFSSGLFSFWDVFFEETCSLIWRKGQTTWSDELTRWPRDLHSHPHCITEVCKHRRVLGKRERVVLCFFLLHICFVKQMNFRDTWVTVTWFIKPSSSETDRSDKKSAVCFPTEDEEKAAERSREWSLPERSSPWTHHRGESEPPGRT